jgi:hypothetical protein
MLNFAALSKVTKNELAIEAMGKLAITRGLRKSKR